jgi:hypothetical protein
VQIGAEAPSGSPAEAPAQADAEAGEEAPHPDHVIHPEDVQGAQFFKKNKKHTGVEVVHKKKVFAKPRTIFAALYRFKVGPFPDTGGSNEGKNAGCASSDMIMWPLNLVGGRHTCACTHTHTQTHTHTHTHTLPFSLYQKPKQRLRDIHVFCL